MLLEQETDFYLVGQDRVCVFLYLAPSLSALQT